MHETGGRKSRIVCGLTQQGRSRTETVVECGGPSSTRLAGGSGGTVRGQSHGGETLSFQRLGGIVGGMPVLSD